MQTAKKALSTLLNPFFCKIYLVIISFINEIPVIPVDFTNWLMLGLFWGAAIFVYEIYRGSYQSGRHAFWLSLVLLSYTFTVFLNYKNYFPENLSDLLYMFVLFTVVYPVGNKKSRDSYLRDISIFNYITIGLTLVATSIGLFMFIIQFGTYVQKDFLFPVGFLEKRLTGIYKNAIYPTAGIGLITCLIQFFINRKLNFRHKRSLNLLLALNACVNFLFICLMNSKGNFIALSTASFVMVGLSVYYLISRHWLRVKKYFLRVLTAVLAGSGAAAVIFLAIFVTRHWIAYVPPIVKQETVKEEVRLPPPIDIDRDEIPEEYGRFTGRWNIWGVGMERLSEKPVFGYGAFADDITIPNVKEKWCHYHNVYVNSLVSQGVAGFIPMMAFFAISVLSILKFLFKDITDRYYFILLSVFVLLTFLFVINLGDTTILFMKKHSSFIFWIYLGYAIRLARTVPSQTDTAIQNFFVRLRGLPAGNKASASKNS